MKTYTTPQLTAYGDVAEITATLGDPFTGDTSFDIDGNVIETGINSVDQCPTVNQETCMLPEQP